MSDSPNNRYIDKFDFFEKVKLLPKSKKEKSLHGKEGVILGKSFTNDGWEYLISYDIKKLPIAFLESELESLNSFAKKESYYPGDKVIVQVNENNKGTVKQYIKNKKDL